MAEPFYARISKKVKEFCDQLLLDEPELRSLGVVFDYAGPLNNSEIPSGAWIGRGPAGVVDNVESIYGSLTQTAKLLKRQTDRAVQLGQQIQARLETLGHEERKKTNPGGQSITRADPGAGAAD